MKKFTDKINESVENRIPTAEEFFKQKGTLIVDEGTYTNDTPLEYIVEFTKMHVEAALKAASEDAHTKDVPYTDDVEVDKDSILSAYPLENIK